MDSIENRPITRALVGDPLQATLYTVGMGPLVVEVLHLSEAGGGRIRAALPPQALQPGQRCCVELAAEHLSTPIHLPVQVTGSRAEEDPGWSTFSLLIDDWEAVRADLWPRIRSAFNRRRDVRVSPEHTLRAQLRLQDLLPGAPVRVEGEVVDLSGGGLSVRTPAPVAARLPREVSFQVQLRLPGATQPLFLPAHLLHVHRASNPRYAHLALEAPPDLNPSAVRDLRRYVMERQRDLARRRAEGRG